MEHILHLVLPAGENSPKCGVYSIGVRLMQLEGSVDVAFVVVISVGTHEVITFKIADFELVMMKQPCMYELLLNICCWSQIISC